MAKRRKAKKKTTKRTKKRSTKRTKKSKRTGPTAFQKFLMRDPAAAKRKMGW